MGNVIGIVAEYNPFHNGHARLIEQTRAQLAPILDELCRDYGSAGSLTPEQAQLCTARFLEQLDALREAGTVLPLD